MTALPKTVTFLLNALTEAGARPRVEGQDLVCDKPPPSPLDLRLAVLHTGVRAVLTRRPWYGCDCDSGFAWELNPAAPVPAQVGLLCVGGDAGTVGAPVTAAAGRSRRSWCSTTNCAKSLELAPRQRP